MENKYTYQQVTEENLEDIIYLYKEVYGEIRDIDAVKKKFDTRSLGCYTIGYIAYSESGQPAAYYGVFPIKIVYNEKTELAAQSGNTITHQDHRRKGLFVELAKKTYKRAEEEGVSFVFGFPVEAAYKGLVNKLNWTHQTSITKVSINTPTLPLTLLFGKALYRKYAEVVLQILRKSEIFPDSNFGNTDPKLKRDKHFNIYKKDNSKPCISFMGMVVWFQIKNHQMIIGDLDYDKLTPSQIIFRLRLLCGILGLLRCTFHVSPNSNLAQIFSTSKKFSRGLPIGYLNFNSHFPLERLCFTYADFDTF